MNKQRGQDLIEFALVIPLFLIFILGIMYCGFFFGDYVTLNNEARSAARVAVIGVSSRGDKTTVYDYYKGVVDDYDKEVKGGVITYLYKYQGMLISDGTKDNTYSSIPNLKQVPNDADLPEHSIIVIIQTVPNKDYLFPGFLTNHGIPLLNGYQIRYVMYNENGATGTNP